MKQINLIILLFTFGQMTSFAQNYESVLGKDTTHWNFVTDYGGADFIATVQFKVFGDTVIKEKEYRVLSEDYIHGVHTFGFLREDTTQGKLWLKKLNDTSEYLIMDLNLNVNDTFLLRNSQWDGWDEKFVVKEISDTSGKIVKLQGTESFNDISFIEGIGVDYSFHIIEEPWIYYEFLCSYKDNVQTFDNPDFGDCYIPFTGTDISDITTDQIRIYPIPTKNKLTIEIENSQINNCKIYNINGILINNFTFNSSELIIDVANYRSGLYLIKINDKITKKIIINGY
jgi:hypothetical protein